MPIINIQYEKATVLQGRIWTRDFSLLMVSLLLVSCANYFFASSIAIYANAISDSATLASMVTSAFYFGSVGMRLVNGTLVQHHGSRLLMVLGAATCAFACLANNLAVSIGLLLALRVAHGIGYSVFSTASGTAASYLVPKSRIAEGMGYFTIGNVLAMAVGPAVALALVADGTTGEFHVLFLVAAGICAVAVGLSAVIRPGRGDAPRCGIKPDESGLPKTFLGFEKGVVSPALISFLMSFAYSPVIVYLTSYGIARGWGGVGMAFTAYAVGLLGSRLFTGRLSDTLGPDVVMVPAYCLGAAALVIIALAAEFWQVCVAMVLLGLCIGAYNPQINVFCISRCSEQRRGTATAAFNGASDLGLAMGSAVSGLLISSLGYTFTYLQGAVICGATLVIYLLTLAGSKGRKARSAR